MTSFQCPYIEKSLQMSFTGRAQLEGNSHFGNAHVQEIPKFDSVYTDTLVAVGNLIVRFM